MVDASVVKMCWEGLDVKLEPEWHRRCGAEY